MPLTFIGVLHEIISRWVLNSFSSHHVVIFIVVPFWVLLFRLLWHLIILGETLDLISLVVLLISLLWFVFMTWITRPPTFLLINVFPVFSTLNQQRPVKDFSVNINHFLFVLLFFPPFLFFELFNFLFNYCPWSSYVSTLTISENWSDIWCKLLLSHLTHSWSPFLFLYFALFLHLLLPS